jgi:hypothetical protein
MQNGIGHRNVYRMPAKAPNPTLELAPGEGGPPNSAASVLSGSLDGRYLYVLSSNPARRFEIIRFDTTSGAQQVVFGLPTDVATSTGRPTITPDGRFVLLMTSHYGGQLNTITRYDLVAGKSVTVDALSFDASDVVISPDGTRFWEDSFNFFAPKPHPVYMRTIPGGVTVGQFTGEAAGWLPSGQGLVATDGEIDAVSPSGGFTVPYVDLTNVSAYSDGPTVSWPRHIAS